jgi:hypothetical protein
MLNFNVIMGAAVGANIEMQQAIEDRRLFCRFFDTDPDEVLI